ncbi:Sjogren's syndrome/scleroderma autoantigen 1 family protein [Halorarum halobium]|uniref:Sjogren's syndrome/scleroderma autoantigen 1 family protein n=1 Tax=Halorarum halobium TaxID=3075121 RepID=UPI0028AAF651|nr:Sjogren's syndrome/scleroderma autoantigen 1 family protein [Halobaculum sp. XH14]
MSDSDTNAGDAGEPHDSGDPSGSGPADSADDSGFDKEAEREKLREKFARDERKRESTRRMSELLLKGATMTNRHCDACGDPLFRQNGQEFCATCREDDGVPAGENAAKPDADAESRGERAAAATTEPTEPAAESTDTTAAPSSETHSDPSDDDSVPPNVADDSTAPGNATGGRPTAPSQARTDADARSPPSNAGGAARSEDRTAASPPAVSNPDAPGTTGGLGEAREALVAALARHATAGAETEDPRAARDHLAAAREAAEALSALRR